MKSETTVLHGDNREVLKRYADNSFHAIVTDPPYEFGFMGKAWDRSGIAYDVGMWAQCLRVLKPGGYLLSFGGSRTYHRMACAIEDAGFEIRDMIEWLYGSGFPKSMDVSKALDKKAGAKREVIGKRTDRAASPRIDIRGGKFCTGEANRPTIITADITAPTTDEAKRWSGYGTALKPAHEPICVARKPLEGTVIENVLKWGCGAVNVDACRISAECGTRSTERKIGSPGWGGPNKRLSAAPGQVGKLVPRTPPAEGGRFPANLILDSDAAALLDVQSGHLQSGQPCGIKKATNQIYGKFKNEGMAVTGFGDAGGASRFFQRCDYTEAERELNLQFALRFFYTAKASGSDRGNHTKSALPLFDVPEEVFRNSHPTVKPLALIRYLLKLVVPGVGLVGDRNLRGDRSPGIESGDESPHSKAKVLDPFLGSGTTALACRELGIDCTGIELEAEHLPIIRERLGQSGKRKVES